MKAADFYSSLKNTDLLSEETLPSLRQLVDAYPYFNIARMLYLKNLAAVKDIQFDTALKNMSVCISDRKKLFTLIEGERYGLQKKQEKEEASQNADAFSLIDAFLSSRKEEEIREGDATLLFQPSVSSDYMYWSLTKDVAPEEEPTVKLQHHDLIDSFIKNEEQRIPGSGLGLDISGENIPGPIQEEEPPKSLGDSYFTETLAHIYVKQKRYEKALQIIKNLNLKYPEKNVYFADQIKFLEKLIINTKK